MTKIAFMHQPFTKFLMVSGIAALVNFLSRMAIGYFTSYSISIVIAFIFGISTAYLLCRFFVFQSKKNTRAKEMFFFLIVNLFALLQTLGVSLLLYHYILFAITDIFVREEVAHFVGICVPAITSYFGHKYFSFK